MSLKLEKLLQGIQISSVHACGDTEICGISCDSRTVACGELFVAVPGTDADGTQFIAQAFEKGAVCAVCQNPPGCAVPYVEVPCARRALAVLAANYYGRPADELTLIGVTGTNGKTTTTCLIKHILEQAAGGKVGLIGTVENQVGEQSLPAERTTPPPQELHRLLRQMADEGCSHVVMEVSSHALALERTYGITFDVGVFTNLTRDHLDFHGTMERYCAAKAKLMRSCRTAVYNADDPWSKELLRGSTCRRFGYGVHQRCDMQARDIIGRSDGVSYTACTAWERVSAGCGVPGDFSVYNSLAAMAACAQLGVPTAACAKVLLHDRGAKGRMETVPCAGKDCTVIIDYAHTPDALKNVLQTVRGFTQKRVIAVFGCGGDRDRAKRPQMGAIAAQLADVAVVTTDNPRTEEPMSIIADIVSGMSGTEYVVVENRVRAIYWALDHAQCGDTVVLCGKGHETYQEIGKEKYHLDEREIIAQYGEDLREKR